MSQWGLVLAGGVFVGYGALSRRLSTTVLSGPLVFMVCGLAIGPLGAVSVTLVILQPVLFDAWCTLCLASAAISVAMIGPALDELLASLQHVKREHRCGRSLWRVFWGLDPAAHR